MVDTQKVVGVNLFCLAESVVARALHPICLDNPIVLADIIRGPTFTLCCPVFLVVDVE